MDFAALPRIVASLAAANGLPEPQASARDLVMPDPFVIGSHLLGVSAARAAQTATHPSTSAPAAPATSSTSAPAATHSSTSHSST